jgi:levansucrase
MALSAPERSDPALRHFEAKIRWLERRGENWIDHGDVLPAFAIDYEREWAGTALRDHDELTLFFTGAGTAHAAHGYQQRLFSSSARLTAAEEIGPWTQPQLLLGHPQAHYQPADAHAGEPGKIKAFRDPAHFRDPADGQDYLLFSASLAGSNSAFNGAVGLARRAPSGGWELLPPLVHADGVNNEMERAHMVHHAGRYYLFWVTQRSTFAPEYRHMPTGLYGMVADRLYGDYRPLNGSGLVLTNPKAQPMQAYSWHVTADLLVSSFVDMLQADAAAPGNASGSEGRFGGVPAPLVRIALHDDCATIANELCA